MKPTGYYKLTESDGWIHVLLIQIGETNTIKIEDNTDFITVTATSPDIITPAETATLWRNHQMGTSAFQPQCPQLDKSPDPGNKDRPVVIWKGSGVDFSHLDQPA